MKKTFFTTLVLLAGTSVLSAENIITTPIDSDLYPTVGEMFDFSPEAIQAFKDREAKYAQVLKDYEAGRATQEQLEAAEYDDTFADVYDILGGGCSFYCGCQYDTVICSSFLPPQGSRTYGWKARQATALANGSNISSPPAIRASPPSLSAPDISAPERHGRRTAASRSWRSASTERNSPRYTSTTSMPSRPSTWVR